MIAFSFPSFASSIIFIRLGSLKRVASRLACHSFCTAGSLHYFTIYNIYVSELSGVQRISVTKHLWKREKNTGVRGLLKNKKVYSKRTNICSAQKVRHVVYVSDLLNCRMVSNGADSNDIDLQKGAWQTYIAKYP